MIKEQSRMCKLEKPKVEYAKKKKKKRGQNAHVLDIDFNMLNMHV